MGLQGHFSCSSQRITPDVHIKEQPPNPPHPVDYPSYTMSSVPTIPGQQVPQPHVQALREQVRVLLGRDSERFPGAQPISFARNHLSELQRSEYFMCEKTDGIRCLLFLSYIDTPEGFYEIQYLIDRKNNYYPVPKGLHFPHHQHQKDDDKFSFGTLLDGELVNDRVPGQPKPRLMFYVFDCLAVDNINMMQRTLDKRLGYMDMHLFGPYNNYLKTHASAQAAEPFRVKRKQMHSSYHISDMFRNILSSLPHGNDGLVFTCKNTPYQPGTDPHILKWKPPHENTIDFKLRLGEFPMFDPEDGEDGLIPDYDAMPDRFQLLVLHNSNQYQPFQHDLHIEETEWEDLKGLGQPLDGRIIECYRDKHGRWRYKQDDDGTPRFRDDKKDANHVSTVNSVLESIEDPVTEQDLIATENKIRDAVKVMREREAEIQQRKVRDMEHRDDMEREGKKRKLSE